MRDRKIRIVACTLSIGQGNGIAAMDNLLWSKIDRNKFDLTYCYTSITENQVPPENTYHVYVPLDNRYEILKKLFSKADIVQFNGGYDPVVCDAAKSANVPIVVEVMHQCERGQRMQNIDLTVCVSRTVKHFQPIKEKACVIQNGIDTVLFKPSNINRNCNSFVILQVARKNKSLHFDLNETAHYLLEADPRIEIWTVGAGLQRMEKYQGRLKQLGVCKDMHTLYQKADVMLLASVQEPFGLASIEAMACECLPIVSADGAMSDIVDHEKNGWLLSEPNIEDAKKIINKAINLKDTKKINLMQKKAREKVVSQYSDKISIGRYEQLYSYFHTVGSEKQNIQDDSFSISSESLLAQTFFEIQASIPIDKVLSKWTNIDSKSITPLKEPRDPANIQCIRTIEDIFKKIGQAGYTQLSTHLLTVLHYIKQ